MVELRGASAASVPAKPNYRDLLFADQLTEHRAMMVKLSTVRAAIDLESELPGGMPDEMWESIRDDRDACERAFKIAVIETKSGIKSRLAHFLNEGK